MVPEICWLSMFNRIFIILVYVFPIANDDARFAPLCIIWLDYVLGLVILVRSWTRCRDVWSWKCTMLAAASVRLPATYSLRPTIWDVFASLILWDVGRIFYVAIVFLDEASVFNKKLWLWCWSFVAMHVFRWAIALPCLPLKTKKLASVFRQVLKVADLRLPYHRAEQFSSYPKGSAELCQVNRCIRTASEKITPSSKFTVSRDGFGADMNMTAGVMICPAKRLPDPFFGILPSNIAMPTLRVAPKFAFTYKLASILTGDGSRKGRFWQSLHHSRLTIP